MDPTIINQSRRRSGWSLVPITLGISILLWYIFVYFGEFPAFIFPPPNLVWKRFLDLMADGSLLRNFYFTLLEVIGGLVFGIFSATTLGYLLAKSRKMEKLLSPYIVASQSVPIVAIAPLFIIWFGPGITSKVIICSLIVFFPILINTIIGIRSVPEDLYDLMRSLQANRWQIFSLLEFPAALPVLFGGLRIGATLSVIGAVVGEFVGADRGLGFMINVGRGQYDTAKVFVAIFSLVFMALFLYGAILFIEQRLLKWNTRPEQRILNDS